MNKFFKVTLSFLGAVNLVFNMFVPIAIALLMIVVFNLSNFNQRFLLIIAIIATLFRAVRLFIAKDDE